MATTEAAGRRPDQPGSTTAAKPAAAAAVASNGTLWTCPMHPEIVRDGPGACPICGMALEPMTAGGGGAARQPRAAPT